LAFGPNTARDGDQVIYLSNATVPFVMRPASASLASYTTIGDCYVHDYMHGEILIDQRIIESKERGEFSII
jgi:hypothetical protein